MPTPQRIIQAVAEFRELIDEANLLRDEIRRLLDDLRAVNAETRRLQGMPDPAPKRPALALVKSDPEC